MPGAKRAERPSRQRSPLTASMMTTGSVRGFLLVEKGTRRPWLAFLVALVLVLIPGSPFKNYIPLLAVANTLCLLHVALTPADARGLWWKALVAGFVLGISFLIRIDIAFLFAAIWVLLFVVRGVFGTMPFAARAVNAVAGLALLIIAAVLPHGPVWMDAQKRGFDRPFAAQYLEKWRMLERPVTRLLFPPPPRPRAGVHAQIPRRAALNAPDEETPVADKKTLQRATLKSLTKVGQNSGPAFVFLCYAPLLAVGVFVPWALFAWVSGLRRRDGELERRGLAVLVLVGGALSTFPQFFFFRPDVPHLSEFMPGFLTASAAAAGLLWTGVASWRNWRTVFTAFLLAIVAVYLVRILPDRWAGTYTIRNSRKKLFTAENGVRVFVSSREFAGLTAIQKLLREFAPNPRDYVVCYPYSPGINLLANRPTYERNVYVDNATRTTRWDAEAIARFEKFQPAVIVLSDWNINGSEASRFSVWAVKTKTWIQSN